ncbi:GNAT family N-acetyltransferase [Aulosira sp. FACHB-615]|uniref:GNAT family N-acetyltransferase n=1 Tax=Aulosira sp. FACHB-615 TaxID=2692777 RepID=UPI0016879C39|nr:GNAT family protein [Aulosira sp. FACHB-615]MBD2488326.1 GNAT family N-acetyltransferase [Aulosira sp. FACHB-615]
MPLFTLQLETPRLLLREFQNSDKVAFAAYRSDPEIAKYQTWDTPYSEAQAAAFIESLQHLTPGILGEWYQLAIELKSTGQMIGDCAFCILAEDGKQAEIGFTLARKYQGNGYATEAVTCLLNYLFIHLNLHRVRSNCDSQNIASIKLLERVGMRVEGCFIKSLWFKNNWVDEMWFAILQDEFEPKNPRLI